MCGQPMPCAQSLNQARLAKFIPPRTCRLGHAIRIQKTTTGLAHFGLLRTEFEIPEENRSPAREQEKSEIPDHGRKPTRFGESTPVSLRFSR